MKLCGKCGGEGRTHLIPRYEAKKELMGGMRVELVNAVQQVVCEQCATVMRTDIPDMPGLVAAVAVGRSKEGLKLNGEEIRFLRKVMGKTGKELAQELRVSDETVSRWENGHLLMGEPVERIFRWKVCKALEDKAPGVVWDDNEILTRMNIVSVRAHPLVMTFHRLALKRREQWREAA